MSELEMNLSRNLSSCRKKAGLTQKQVADALQYSDKAVSKWERGEGTPDVSVLKALADLYGVSIDSLLDGNHEETPERKKKDKQKKTNYIIICLMSILLVFLIATILFVIFEYLAPNDRWHNFMFIYAIPIACIVWLVLNSCWLNRRLNFLIISLLVWSFLLTVYVTFIPLNLYLNFIFVLGAPGQLIIFLWSRIKKIE